MPLCDAHHTGMFSVSALLNLAAIRGLMVSPSPISDRQQARASLLQSKKSGIRWHPWPSLDHPPPAAGSLLIGRSRRLIRFLAGRSATSTITTTSLIPFLDDLPRRANSRAVAARLTPSNAHGVKSKAAKQVHVRQLRRYVRWMLLPRWVSRIILTRRTASGFRRWAHDRPQSATRASQVRDEQPCPEWQTLTFGRRIPYTPDGRLLQNSACVERRG